MHGLRVYFKDERTLAINHVIPNVFLNVYLGENPKYRQSIIEIIVEKIKKIALKNSQNKAFNEIEKLFNKIRVDN